MAKSKTPPEKSKNVKPPQGGIQLNFLNKDDRNTRLVFVGIIVLALLMFFFRGLFDGKVFASPDNLSPLSFKTFTDDAKAQGIFPLWVPYIFMGMPSLASLTAALLGMQNIFSFVTDSVLSGISGDNLFILTLPYYFLFAITLFYYMRYKLKNNFIALFCALTGVFATGIIQLIIVGHHTKMMTFSFFPLILLFLDKLIDSEDENRFKLMINFAILTVIVYLQLHFHHIQMLFYSYMMIGLYVLYIFIYRLINKIEVGKMIRAVALLIAAVIVALAMDADIILSVKEYNKFSMRGESSVVAKNDSNNDGKPLSYDYATNWSFSPGEVMTFIIPHYYGFGNVDVDGQKANLYWGQMPFTESPVYFGIVVLLLAIIGSALNFRKNPFVQIITLIIIFFLFLSFGRTFPLIYNLFYNYLPYFSSFRAPVMIHYYMDLAFVILAGFGVKSLIEVVKEQGGHEKLKKMSYLLFGIAGLMLLISFVGFEGSYTNSITSGPLTEKLRSQGANPQQVTQYMKQISGIAYKNVINDLMMHSFLLLIVISGIYFYSTKKITSSVLGVIIIVIALFDILNVSLKTLHWDDKAQKESFIAETDFVKWLLSKEPNTYEYRIAEYSRGGLTTSNNLAYFRFHCFNGYQGAKLRIYQDAIDVAGGENPFLQALANVKYIVSDSPIKDTTAYKEVYKGSNIIYQNKLALPRAYFADDYKIETGLNILNNIRSANFDPRKLAYVEKDPGRKIDKADSNATAKITKFDIHNIDYDVNAVGNNFLVLSEVYYPAGWKAFVDGQETEIYKTNYLLRGVIIPAGKHKLELKFRPEIYFTGKTISLAANGIVILIFIASIGGYYFRKKKPEKV